MTALFVSERLALLSSWDSHDQNSFSTSTAHDARAESDLVSVLLEGRLVLEVRPPSTESACLCVYVQGAVDPAEAAGRLVPGRDVLLLERHDEVAQQGVDGTHLTESIHCTRILSY